MPACGASGVRRSPTPDHLSLGRAAGAHYPLAADAGDAGVGTRHRPDSARSCELALRVVGAARGRPGGGASCLRVARPRLGASTLPTARPWGVRPGFTTHWLWVRGVWEWGTVINPTARALASRLCRCGGGTRAPGGGASCLRAGCLGSGALPRPTACPWGVRPGPTTLWLRLRGMRAWGPVTNPTARALARWPCTLSGRHEGAQGAAPRACVWGVLGWALPHARPSVLGAEGRGSLPTGCGCGGCGRGDPTPTPQRALLRAGFARCGGGTMAPGGGASCLCVGRPGLGAYPRPTARPWGVRPGPTTHRLWVRGVRAMRPVTNPTVRALASWLCALWRLVLGMRKNILEKSETRQNNRSFHMKPEQTIAHFMKNTLFFEKMRNWHPNQ